MEPEDKTIEDKDPEEEKESLQEWLEYLRENFEEMEIEESW